MTEILGKTEIRNPKSETSLVTDGGLRNSEFEIPIPTDPPVSRLERTLRAYEESLLRQVAGKLLRPRGLWPIEELIERCRAAFDNIATIDRRLKELNPPARRLLALIDHSDQRCWPEIHRVDTRP